MPNKKHFLPIFLLFCGTICLFSYLYWHQTPKKEYLQIVTLNYRNGIDTSHGITMALFAYDIAEKKANLIADLPVDPTYPVAYYDRKRNCVFYSDDKIGAGYDNLFQYDLDTKESKQITFGKNEFNDMFVVNDKLYLNVAPQYSTVMKPAIFNMDTYEITYLDETDDDTWYTSLSYHHRLKKLLALTHSDAEMRTHRVTAETHIRPKNIVMMEEGFQNQQTLYHTEDFEICLTRQLDENHILMTADKMMVSPEPRVLKLLEISSGTVSDFPIPGIYEVYSFYPTDDGSRIFILGRNDAWESNLYIYDFQTKKIDTVFHEGDLPSNHRNILDFIYTIY